MWFTVDTPALVLTWLLGFSCGTAFVAWISRWAKVACPLWLAVFLTLFVPVDWWMLFHHNWTTEPPKVVRRLNI